MVDVRKDARDDELFKRREKLYNEIDGPRIGDYIRVLFPNGDAPYTRITHIWKNLGLPDSIQSGGLGGSYYLGDGYISYSGSLTPGIPGNFLRPTKQKRKGNVWIFHHDFQYAHNGVEYNMDFRVYEVDYINMVGLSPFERGFPNFLK